MLTKRESKQPAPSVMSRLMGLDEMPPQQGVQKKPRVLSENYLRRVASIGVREKWSKRHSFNLNIEEQDEHNNVLQVLQVLRKNKHHSMPVQKKEVYMGSSEVQMKVTEAKRVLGDKKLQSSKECHDSSTAIDLETQNILKYVWKPDFWVTKEINESNDVHLSLQSGPIAVLKSPCASECRDISMCRKLRRKIEQGYSLNKVQSRTGITSGEIFIDDKNKFSRSKFKPNNRSYLPTAKIVVLKPNSGNADSAIRSFSFSSQLHNVSHPGNGKQNGILSPYNGNLYAEVKKSKNFANAMGSVRPRFRFLRERTTKVGHGTGGLPTEDPSSKASGGDLFAKESESTIPSSPTVSDRKRQFYNSDGPNKKQISEKWKKTKRFQQVELASRSKTSGVMLSIPDKLGKCGLSKQVDPYSRDVNLGTPLAISSSDGWSSECIRDFPRSKSLLACFNAVGSPNTGTNYEHLEDGRYISDLQSINLVQNKSREKDFDQKDDGSDCRSSDSSYKKSRPSSYLQSENNSLVGYNYVVQNELENTLKERDSGGQISAVTKSSGKNNRTLQDVWMNQEGHKNEGWEEDLPEHQLESRNRILSTREEDSSCYIQDTSVQQDLSSGTFEEKSVSSPFSCADPESLISFEEAYQPSPNSVLEPFYNKDISSSSDCFKSVNVSLHEGSNMMVSSDEDNGEGSVNDSEENEGLMRPFRVEESRDFSYLIDVLTEAGFHNRNLDAGFDTWHPQVSYSVFETLEKKYGEQISWKRSERRLLFDRINSGLMEILQPSMGVLTWTKPVAKRFSFSLRHDLIEEELWMLLDSQEKEARREYEKFPGKDDGWLEFGDDIQVIGREIENSLIDELLADVTMESF
ncbi:hypothetical protein P3X46_014182 [Hevea brasiliensis]|uniref:DUF4378 domain-containing protein n=1 Tax=Hevea brasiliensis TaxID=3981 RepID=A0ABQ9M9I8_HEVBR|nr:uncharacterized protein LOC110663961 isoform X1 [Hevea brasiliensis]XP_058007666.1 uncharacterized protein LOC110663961 isoform X1 [Hevea brasiliensis]KAJ9175645.1 hypothetical protein P3X46_014182 [Hevea brasiliensis]